MREMHGVSSSSATIGMAHVARTFCPADLDDARQTHWHNYADEPIVALQH
jgi:hypothetical protein